MKRLWGIRHLRYVIVAWRLRRLATMWARMGLGTRDLYDRNRLAAIWRGEA